MGAEKWSIRYKVADSGREELEWETSRVDKPRSAAQPRRDWGGGARVAGNRFNVESRIVLLDLRRALKLRRVSVGFESVSSSKFLVLST